MTLRQLRKREKVSVGKHNRHSMAQPEGHTSNKKIKINNYKENE